MKKEVIAYLHTHWDREWYREYEIFRMRLLRVFDNVIHLLENNRIPCFYFDGQTSALEDYLEIRPEKTDLIKSLIFSKKLYIGPFYCLIDEFLTDKTSFEKNLEIGMTKAINLGCTDFIGYLPDTFGHSQNVLDILRDFGIDKCMVWRGCGDFPAEFRWCGMDTVNLVRGYFNDIFSSDYEIEKKAEILKRELDLISKKSGNYLLLPIGADHLGVPEDIDDQIISINELLKEDYHITLGSPFDYFEKVKDNFKSFEFNNELRDNTKTFILSGTHSSRLDLKRYNVECSHLLDIASRFVRFCKAETKYNNLIEYAYKLLLQNQAHDGICGCSTDDVHLENIIRYKKIKQIAETIIDELKFTNNFDEKTILNLADKPFSGIIEIKSTKELNEFEKISCNEKGFSKELLTNTQKIPVTEDYTCINTYLTAVENLQPDKIDFLVGDLQHSDLDVTKNLLKNSKIKLEIKNNAIYINDIAFSLVDFIDKGDSYNNGPVESDSGIEFKIFRTRIELNTRKRATLRIDYESARDIVTLYASLDAQAQYIKFSFDWNNTQKNHLLEAAFELKTPIKEVFSEDMNTLIKRKFNPNYNIREHLPKEKGLEAKTNTAPMQRGLIIDEAENNLGLITKGLTQYEVCKNKLYLPILRSTGVISNPINPARSTPAGPPIETPNLQMLGNNKAEFYVFFGNERDFKTVLDTIYNYIIV